MGNNTNCFRGLVLKSFFFCPFDFADRKVIQPASLFLGHSSIPFSLCFVERSFSRVRNTFPFFPDGGGLLRKYCKHLDTLLLLLFFVLSNSKRIHKIWRQHKRKDTDSGNAQFCLTTVSRRLTGKFSPTGGHVPRGTKLLHVHITFSRKKGGWIGKKHYRNIIPPTPPLGSIYIWPTSGKW